MKSKLSGCRIWTSGIKKPTFWRTISLRWILALISMFWIWNSIISWPSIWQISVLKLQMRCQLFAITFIDDLLEKELGQRKIEQDSFKMTLIFPLEYKTTAEEYLASNGKQKLIELRLVEMGVGWCRNAERSAIYAICRCVLTITVAVLTRAVTALFGTERATPHDESRYKFWECPRRVVVNEI